jgi:cystathionine gamma-lyase/cystathionine beta-lyase/cystathionine gamma-lyase/homocysteine desulfhydrase
MIAWSTALLAAPPASGGEPSSTGWLSWQDVLAEQPAGSAQAEARELAKAWLAGSAMKPVEELRALVETVNTRATKAQARLTEASEAARYALSTKASTYEFDDDTISGDLVRPDGDALARKGRFEVVTADLTDPAALAIAMATKPALVWVETPSNPLLRITDLRRVSESARAVGARVVVDNTFLSPALQTPIAMGADVVVHSTTKFLNGHSDGLGGVVVCTTKEQAEQLAFIQKSAGAIMSPFECWLVLRGVKTLEVRMLRHDENGRRIAEYLDGHRRVEQVFYPGLAKHPQHELARRQMSGFGSMITFETGSLANAKKLQKRARGTLSLAESLGGVETLISHPATMTHAALGEKGRRAIGITDGMVRISVGIENLEDIISDLDYALAGI